MIVYQRQQRILEYLETKQSATIRELARLLYTSESSVRRDIATLEMQGCVQKTYGGVLLSKYQNQVVPINLRDGENSSVKDELARRAAQMIRDGDTVIIVPFNDVFGRLFGRHEAKITQNPSQKAVVAVGGSELHPRTHTQISGNPTCIRKLPILHSRLKLQDR